MKLVFRPKMIICDCFTYFLPQGRSSFRIHERPFFPPAPSRFLFVISPFGAEARVEGGGSFSHIGHRERGSEEAPFSLGKEREREEKVANKITRRPAAAEDGGGGK